MKTRAEKAVGGITLGPCQVCFKVKEKFFLCNRNHTTCDDCKEVRQKNALQPQPVSREPSPSGRRVQFVLPSTPESPFSDTPSNPNDEEGLESTSTTQSRRSKFASNDPPSIFSERSPIRSLVTIPTAGGTSAERLTPEPDVRKLSGRGSPQPPRVVVEEDDSRSLEIFCQACDDFVEATLMNLPMNMLKSLVSNSFDPVDAERIPDADDDEDFDSADTLVPNTSSEVCNDAGLRRHLDELRDGLVSAYSEIMTTRSDLDEVIYATEKLEMDVDMLRGGVNYVYFNFDTIEKCKEVRVEERICGIPFVLMVRMRMVARVRHLGFFIGLEPYEGRAHSPLKKIIVFRAHNAYGKVIEKHTLETFENGQCAHPCFDLTQHHDAGLWGYSNFLTRDRILKPDMLKDGRLCLSLQIKPLM